MGLHPDAQRVQDGLRLAGSAASVHELAASTRTSAEAAEALGVEVGAIAKSLIFLADARAVMVVASGAVRVDTRRLSEATGGAKITRADADAVRAATGYPIGGVSPVGLAGVEVIVDPSLAAFEVVWAAAGTPNAVFPTTYGELVVLAGARVADVAERPRD